MSVYWKTTDPERIAIWEKAGEALIEWGTKVDKANASLIGWKFVKYSGSFGFEVRLEPTEGNDGTNPRPPRGWTFSKARGNARARSDNKAARKLARDLDGPNNRKLLLDLGLPMDLVKRDRWYSPGLRFMNGAIYVSWPEEAGWEGAEGYQPVKASEYHLASEAADEPGEPAA